MMKMMMGFLYRKSLRLATNKTVMCFIWCFFALLIIYTLIVCLFIIILATHHYHILQYKRADGIRCKHTHLMFWLYFIIRVFSPFKYSNYCETLNFRPPKARSNHASVQLNSIIYWTMIDLGISAHRIQFIRYNEMRSGIRFGS